MGTRRLLLEGLFFAYWVVRRLFELLILVGRSERAKELEILVLRVGFVNSVVLICRAIVVTQSRCKVHSVRAGERVAAA